MNNSKDENGILLFDVEIDLEDEKLIQEQSVKILEVLRPEWKSDALKFETFTNGITNRIYAVYLKDDNENKEKLIFRVFGKNTDKIISRTKELKNFIRLSKIGLAAQIYARFRNGMICGYLEGSCLDLESVRHPKVVNAICKAMANMHKISLGNTDEVEPSMSSKTLDFLAHVPTSYQTEEMQKRFEEYFVRNSTSICTLFVKKSDEKVELVSKQNCFLPQRSTYLQYFVRFKVRPCNTVVYDYKKFIEQVHFIDYEYADMNFQLFDIGNHFNEYAGVDNPDYTLCPSIKEKRQFIEIYLSYYLGKKPSVDEVETMVNQVHFYEAASNFFWSVWALVQAKNSLIQFDYLGYGILRHQMFRKVFDHDV